MYKITVSDKTYIVEDIRYVRMNPNSGSYIQCNEQDAEGVSINGNLCSLPGKPPIMVTVIEQLDENNFQETTKPADVAQIDMYSLQKFSEDMESINQDFQLQTDNLTLALTEIADSIMK